jgi:outer membrane biosynthesis protein TonB
MNSRATIKWVGLALAGLLVAAGVAIAASNLASQQIGLASEPISAGDALAPAASANHSHGSQNSGHSHGVQTTPTAPTTTQEPQPTTPTPTPEPETSTQPPEPEPESTIPTNPTPGSRDDHGSGGRGADD